MSDTKEIPDDIEQAARVLNMRLHNATELGQRTQWIAEALLAEREAARLETKRFIVALKRLASDSPVGFRGNVQGQSEVRRQYARNVLRGGNP